ncbi:MAG: 3-deoxy-D-manno-octulosonic acid transferase [Desulfobacterales bacterium]|nr:3-deoxy-D-manno-octulosonic acid transferase [Desulfobacterales bacterium]
MKGQKVIFYLYNLVWNIALPFLKKSSTFKDSYKLRTSPNHFDKTDIWMHGASGGEAYVAIEILKNLNPSKSLKILYTATTAQGLEIMQSFCESSKLHSDIKCKITWFPFDCPSIIEKIILKTNPKIMVLLETELWPGHLYMLKKHKIKTIIINARLSSKSSARYIKTRFLWQQINPETILATSIKDAKRYQKIFGSETLVDTMPNIKFDSIPAFDSEPDNDSKQNNTGDTSTLGTIFLPDTKLSILASIRKEEEEHLKVILRFLIKNFPDQIIAIFPKHIQRIKHLSEMLDKFTLELGSEFKFKWQLRSKIGSQVNEKTIVLWDTFGELKHAYAFAITAFVGGSLVPLGGQNFLEPVVCGTATVTGPYLNSFKWVNKDIFESQLVFKAQNALQVGEFMVGKLKNPPDKKELKKRGVEYIRKNQGGTARAVELINNSLN